MKAILVIDMPDRCGECPLFCFQHDRWKCALLEGNTDLSGTRDNRCPLRELPSKRDVLDHAGNPLYNAGFNRCLDEIGGD